MDPQHIIDVCEANWDANKTDCNHFVKAVADALGVSLFNSNDDADSILNKLASASDWSLIPSSADLSTVEADATAGQFIIAGLQSGDFTPPRTHGHVVVVVKGDDPAHPGYPLAYWGTLNGVGQKDSSIRNSFTPNTDLPNVKYYGTVLTEFSLSRVLAPYKLVDAKSTVEELVAAVIDSLGEYSGKDQKERIFFPNGIESIQIDVKAGPVSVGVKVAGPKAPT